MLPNNTILDLNKNIGGLTDLAKKGKNQQICLCPENRTISASLINVLANIKKE